MVSRCVKEADEPKIKTNGAEKRGQAQRGPAIPDYFRTGSGNERTSVRGPVSDEGPGKQLLTT
jgi:hypothetical protein